MGVVQTFLRSLGDQIESAGQYAKQADYNELGSELIDLSNRVKNLIDLGEDLGEAGLSLAFV